MLPIYESIIKSENQYGMQMVATTELVDHIKKIKAWVRVKETVLVVGRSIGEKAQTVWK